MIPLEAFAMATMYALIIRSMHVMRSALGAGSRAESTVPGGR